MIKKYNLSGLWDFELDADKAGLKKLPSHQQMLVRRLFFS